MPEPLTLLDLGWDQARRREIGDLGVTSAEVGRVSRIDRGICSVLTPDRRRVSTAGAGVAIGDWVVLGPGPEPRSLPVVAAILGRRSAFVRNRAGEGSGAQVVAANAEVVFLVASLDTPLNPPRIERYLTLGWQSGARPVMVLTKSDETDEGELPGAVAAVEALAVDVAVRTVSARTGKGVEALAREFLGPGRTAALVGPSGVGKSTLLNRMVGGTIMATGETRSDGRGRHTTTHRELIVMGGRGILIDTPGMRALGLWEAEDGLLHAFADIEELAAGCRFSDCGHATEPGCALTAALAAGTADRGRIEHWRKLRQELAVLQARRLEATRRPPGRPR